MGRLAALGSSDPGPNRIHPKDGMWSSPNQRTSRFTVMERRSDPRLNGESIESSRAPQRAKALDDKDPKDTGDGVGGVQGKNSRDDNLDKSVSLGSTPVVDSLLNSVSKLIMAGERAFRSSHTSGGDDYGGDDGGNESSERARRREQRGGQNVAGAVQDKAHDQVQGNYVGGGSTGDGKGGRMSIVMEDSLSWADLERMDSTGEGKAPDTRSASLIFQHAHFIPIVGMGKERRILIWYTVTCKMATLVTRTTLSTTGPMPADSRQ